MIIQRLDQNPLYQPSDKERKKPSRKPLIVEPRDAFEKDYGKIVHSAAFRRLQSKTQVIGLDAGDFHRTRLTHSMEVAQIARGMIIRLNAFHPVFKEDYQLDASLIEAAALAHDLGHPPFGHRGEEALHECMKDYGGFEGNAHTFRILTRLEGDRENGLNLTRGLLLSIMKYPILLDSAVNYEQYHKTKKIHPPKASAFRCDEEAFHWAVQDFTSEEKQFFQQNQSFPNRHKRTMNQTLECSIIELADDIAYGTHDMEDAIHLKLVQVSELRELIDSFQNDSLYPELKQAYYEIDCLRPNMNISKHQLKNIFSAIISTFISSVEVVDRSGNIHSSRLRYKVQLPQVLNHLLGQLKKLVLERVIESQRVQTVSWKGTYVIHQLFEAIMNESKLLPENDRLKIGNASDEAKARVVCDYIAGMTDSFAMKMYARLYGQSDRFLDP